MQENFAKVMPAVLAHEGGFVNDSHDPGGATKYGITAKTLGAWRGWDGPASAKAVSEITKDEAVTIYRSQYAGAIRFDDLPSGIDYAVLDFAINSGVRRATETLQRVVGAKVDGHLGVGTVSAAESLPASEVVNQLCDARLAFLRGLANWKRYGRGWERRVNDVRAVAVDLARSSEAAPCAAPPPLDEDLGPPGSAADVPPPLTRSRSIWGSVTSLFSGGGVGYTFGEIMRNPHAVWLLAIIVGFVLVAGIALFIVFRDSIKRRIERWGAA